MFVAGAAVVARNCRKFEKSFLGFYIKSAGKRVCVKSQLYAGARCSADKSETQTTRTCNSARRVFASLINGTSGFGWTGRSGMIFLNNENDIYVSFAAMLLGRHTIDGTARIARRPEKNPDAQSVRL